MIKTISNYGIAIRDTLTSMKSRNPIYSKSSSNNFHFNDLPDGWTIQGQNTQLKFFPLFVTTFIYPTSNCIFCNFIKFPRLSNKVLKLLWQDFIFIGLDGFIDQNHLLSIWIDRLTSKSYYLILSSVWRSMSSPSFFQATFVICWTVAFLTRLRLGGSASRTQNQKMV